MVSSWPCRRGSGLVDTGPLDHRIRHPRGRREPPRRGDSGHERGTDDGDHDALGGRVGGLAGVQAALGPSASGLPVPLSLGIVGSIGFDAITVALLGRSRPLGIVLAGLLFGALHAGGLAMQSIAQTPLT